MPNVKGLVNDPDFRSLSSEDKRAALSGIDPEFAHLSNDDVLKFENTMNAQNTASREEKMGLLGGTGQPMSKEDAIALSKERFVDRSNIEGQPNIQMMDGQVKDTSQLSGLGKILSAPRALSSGQTFGLTDAAEKGIEKGMLATGLTSPEVVESIGVKSQKSQETPADVGLNIAGSLMPGPLSIKGLSSAKTPLGRIGKATTIGGVGGALNEATREIANDQNLDPEQIKQNALLSAVFGGATSAIPEAGKFIKDKISSDPVSLVKKALRLPARAKSIPGVENIDADMKTAIEAIKERGLPVEDLSSAGDAVVAAKKDAYDKFLASLNEGDRAKLNVNPTQELNDAFEKIVKDNPSLMDSQQGQKVLQSVVDQFNAVARDIPIEEVNRRVIEANNNYGPLYEAAKSGRGSPALADAQKYIGDILRDKMNTTLESFTGNDVKKWRDQYGALTRMEQALAPRIQVHERQSPFNLNEQIQMGQAAGQAGENLLEGKPMGAIGQLLRPVSAKISKSINDPNNLIKRALSSKNPSRPMSQLEKELILRLAIKESDELSNQDRVNK